MKTQINSDRSIKVSAGLVRFVGTEVDRTLDRFAARVTRLELHLSDVNSHRGGDSDKQCLVEARPAGLRPVSVTATAASVDVAVVRALKKMRRSLTTVFGRVGRSRGRAGSVAKKRTAAKKNAVPARRRS
jgi:hypothetical protein